jgi:hypothetical protein
MALMGTAAMVLSFGIAPVALVEHDDWHSHEHLPERLSIPGFKRGSRSPSCGAPSSCNTPGYAACGAIMPTSGP